MTAERERRTLRRVQAHYDRHGFDFDEPDRAAGILDRRFLGDVIREAAGRGRARIVEAGCGRGVVASYFRRHAPGSQIVGVDLSRLSLAEARRRSGLAPVQADQADLPLAAGCADIVISFGALHCAPDPERAFAELARLLAPGGLLHVSVYNRRHPYAWIYRSLGRLCRAAARLPGGQALLAGLVFPPFYAFYLGLGKLLYHGSLKPVPLRLAWTVFQDQLITPHLHFFGLEEMDPWLERAGLEIEARGPELLGQNVSLTLRRPVVRLRALSTSTG